MKDLVSWKQIRSSEKNNKAFYVRWIMKVIKMGLFDTLKSCLRITPNFRRDRATRTASKSKAAPKRFLPHGKSISILKFHKRKTREPNYSTSRPWIPALNLRTMFKCGWNKWISFKRLLKTFLSSELDLNRSSRILNWCQIKAKLIFLLKMLFSKRSNKMLLKQERSSSSWSRILLQDSWKLRWVELTSRKDKETWIRPESYIQMRLPPP